MADVTLKECDRCGCEIRSPPDLVYGLKITGGDPLWGNMEDLCEMCKTAIENFVSTQKYFWGYSTFSQTEVTNHEATITDFHAHRVKKPA